MNDLVYMVPILSNENELYKVEKTLGWFHVFQNIRYSFIKKARVCIREGEHLIEFYLRGKYSETIDALKKNWGVRSYIYALIFYTKIK